VHCGPRSRPLCLVLVSALPLVRSPRALCSLPFSFCSRSPPAAPMASAWRFTKWAMTTNPYVAVSCAMLAVGFTLPTIKYVMQKEDEDRVFNLQKSAAQRSARRQTNTTHWHAKTDRRTSEQALSLIAMQPVRGVSCPTPCCCASVLGRNRTRGR
jgi:hypothetical protein